MKSSGLMFAILALFCASQVSGRMRFGGFPQFRRQQNGQQEGQESVRQGGQRRNPFRRQPGNDENVPRAVPVPENNELCIGDNEMYMDCGDNTEVRCQPECKVRSDDDAPEECTQTCNDGFLCFCQRDYILKSGDCVKIDECPQDQRPRRPKVQGGQRPGQQRPGQQRPGPGQQRPERVPDNDYLCGTNEMYLDCGEEPIEVRCGPECKVRSDEDEECKLTCTDYMCVCEQGFLLQNGVCIVKDTCPEDQRPMRPKVPGRRPGQQRPGPGQQRPERVPDNDHLCGTNEMYLDCGEEPIEVHCGPECKVRSDEDEECKLTCTDYMCVCERGFLLQNGVCIEIETCPEEQRPTRRGPRGGARPSGNRGESTNGGNTGGRRPGGFGGSTFNRNRGFGGFGGRNPGRGGGFRGGMMGGLRGR